MAEVGKIVKNLLGGRSVVTYVAMSIIGGAPASAQRFDCMIECREGTAFCLALSDTLLEADVGSGFRSLFERLQEGQQPFEIQPSTLQRMFGNVADPCERSSTLVADGRIRNEGKACRVGTQLVAPDGSSITASIVVPEVLVLEMKKELLPVVLNPAPGGGTPYLHFTDSFLQHDWGGNIYQVVFGPEESIITSENGCIKYSYGEE